MPSTLDDLPLEYRPKKTATAMVFGLIILLELIFAVVFEVVAKWPVSRLFGSGLPTTLSFLFMVGVCIWGIVDIVRRQDRLVIDESGVIFHLNGVERRWRWNEMARFHVVLVHARSKLHMIAIERWGEVNFDPKASVIWPRFGPSTDDFLSLLKAGKARWG